MDLQDLFPAAITFAAVGILIAFSLNVQTNIRDEYDGYANCGQNASGGSDGIVYTGCNAEYNATQNSVLANSNLSSKLPILGTILVAAIVVGVLVKAFAFR